MKSDPEEKHKQNNEHLKKADIRPVSPGQADPRPLSKTQHIINGVIIIIVLFILTLAAAVVNQWMHKTEQEQAEVISTVSTSNLAEPGDETAIIAGALDSVSAVSLARASTIVVGTDDFFDIVNPLFSSGDGEKDLVSLLFEPLVVLDDFGLPERQLAKNWYFDESSKQVVFELDSGHFFPDGRAVSAEDVVFTYSCLFHDSYNGPFKDRFSDILSFEGSEDHQEVIFQLAAHIDQPDFSLFTVGILKYDHYEDYGTRVFAMYEDKVVPMGSGSFQLDSLQNDQATVSKRSGYAGNIEEIIFQKVLPEDKFTLLREGQLDVVRSKWDNRLQIRTASLPAYYFYPLNSRVKAYLFAANNAYNDVLKSQELASTILMALAELELDQEQLSALAKIDRSLRCYYFKGVDEQTDAANKEQVEGLAAKLTQFEIAIEPIGKDWPDLTMLLETNDYELLLLPAPSNNRLPPGTTLLNVNRTDFYSANINCWPAYYSMEAIVINARLMQTEVSKNVFPLSVSTAGWTNRVENIRIFTG